MNTTNGQEGLEMVESDRDFDCVLMDIQYVLAFSSRGLISLHSQQDALAERI